MPWNHVLKWRRNIHGYIHGAAWVCYPHMDISMDISMDTYPRIHIHGNPGLLGLGVSIQNKTSIRLAVLYSTPAWQTGWQTPGWSIAIFRISSTRCGLIIQNYYRGIGPVQSKSLANAQRSWGTSQEWRTTFQLIWPSVIRSAHL